MVQQFAKKIGAPTPGYGATFHRCVLQYMYMYMMYMYMYTVGILLLQAMYYSSIPYMYMYL